MKNSLLTLFLLAGASTTDVSAGEYIIKLAPQSFNDHLKDLNVKEYFTVMGERYAKVQSNDPQFLRQLSFVEMAEPNFVVQAFENESESGVLADTYGTKQWALTNLGNNEPITLDRPSPIPGKVGCDISAEKAWTITNGNRNVKIAVLDSGVDYNHPDLKENIWTNEKELNGKPGVDDDGNGYIDDIHGYDIANNDGDPLDDLGHGTHCAGIIGAKHNNLGIAGVMNNVQIIPVKFLDKKGFGDLEKTLKGLEYAINSGARIISNSWGTSRYSEMMLNIIKKAGEEKNILFVAAAGNFRGRNNDVTPTYPASFKVPNVISVLSHTAQDYFSNFTTWGPKSVHIAAPGENIVSTWMGGTYKVASGTSMATPYVSGIVGLLLSIEPDMAVNDIPERVMATGIKSKGLEGKCISEARINAYRLLVNQRD